MKVVIVSGGNLGEWAVAPIKAADYTIGVDRGALFLFERGLLIDAAIGDFDSVDEQERSAISRVCKQFITCDPIMKDWTDTEMAFRFALELKASEIVIVGGIGTRLDHSIANIHLLLLGLEAGITCRIMDETNIVQLVSGKMTFERNRFPYVSLLPLTMEVSGITLTGFRYPLNDATLRIGSSLGISNVLDQTMGTIETKQGILIVIFSTDTRNDLLES